MTPDPGAAALFYQDAFDMDVVRSEVGFEMVAGPLRLFIDPGQARPLVLELVTDDALEARGILRSFGYEELVWRGPGQSCLVRDPFGLVMNIHEDRSAFIEFCLSGPDESIFRPCVGAQSPISEDVAEFYAKLLESPLCRTPDGCHVVDSGSMRLRFRQGPTTAPMVWLRPGTPLGTFAEAGCADCQNGVLIDPFGIHWCAESSVTTTTAVVCPL
ncbi:MAG: hypothetical protein JSS66_10735 [Armatimonadetes bacterium]|nr:hypothetical protein [Armatimonadota bacterium]